MEVIQFLHLIKTFAMKLPKSLLQAMLVGIAIGGATSCKDGLLEQVKDSDLNPTPNKERAVLLPLDVIDVNGDLNKGDYPDNCAACGMG